MFTHSSRVRIGLVACAKRDAENGTALVQNLQPECSFCPVQDARGTKLPRLNCHLKIGNQARFRVPREHVRTKRFATRDGALGITGHTHGPGR